MQPTTTTSGKLETQDLLVVGPGVLGSYLAAQWRARYPSAAAVAQTNTTNNHARCAAWMLLHTTPTHFNYMVPQPC